VRAIEDVTYENHSSLLLCNSDERGLQDPHSKGDTMVAMDRRLPDLDVDTVIVDNIQGAYDAVDQLIRLGHRRIGLIGGPVRITTPRERQEGYVRALLDHGLVLDAALIKTGDFTQDSGQRMAHELLAIDDSPTAIFTANNLMMLGTLNAIHEAGDYPKRHCHWRFRRYALGRHRSILRLPRSLSQRLTWVERQRTCCSKRSPVGIERASRSNSRQR
jgi:DNA-binding LacI/PurR family transcriptional regulator